MGVPSYFRQIVKKYHKIMKKTNAFNGIKHLYFDMNCLIHPITHKVDSEYKGNDYKELELMIFTEIIKYTNEIINKVDADFIMIAIDGIVPRFKMIQQRERRYKSILEREKNVLFDKNSISPGTTFMYNLSKALHEEYQNNSKVLLTDFTHKGEGEHRIIKYIKDNFKVGEEITHILYSLDADVIMLSLSLDHKNVFLMREKQCFEFAMEKKEHHENEHHYLNIDELKNALWMENKNEVKHYITKSQYVKDYIFLCFFVGNDFVPHAKEICIYKNGLSLLLNAYLEYINKYQAPLINKNIIHMNFLIDIMDAIATKENHLVLKNSKKIDINTIGYGSKFWKTRHYKYWYNTNSRKVIDKACKRYWETIKWTVDYYFNNEVPSWKFYFNFPQAPILSDLVKYLRNTRENINYYTFNNDENYSIDQQLFMILPPQSKNLLKEEYRGYVNNELADLFPYRYKLEYVNKPVNWMRSPILPYIDDRRITKYIK